MLAAVLEEHGNGKWGCSADDLVLVAKLFDENISGRTSIGDVEDAVENAACRDADGEGSVGFYLLFLRITKYDATPKPFFKILEVDQKIGWSNPAHVELNVFLHKAIKIIADEQVRTTLILEPNICFKK